MTADSKPPVTPALPTIGRIVHVRIGGTDESPILRPATIVRPWGGHTANLVVTLDGTNDQPACELAGFAGYQPGALQMWLTSSTLGTRVGEWRWPERT
ncbi:MAG TPA: hypothetical protein VEB22_15430 [Phycisphaerales bacterium]|nr:hypothetical protein [Phycisphaerales bacterium]